MTIKVLVVGVIFACGMLQAQDGLRKAFAEGIKASIEVVEHERSQALKDIPEGYCVAVIGKDAPLDMWEVVKLESLALLLELTPSLLESNEGDSRQKVLCMNIAKEKQDALKALEKINKHYPNMDKYITKVDILPTKMMHRIIPGVGRYFEDRSDEIKALKDTQEHTDKPLNGRIILLSGDEKSKTFFNNGSTRVLGTALKNVLFIEHTVYRKKSQ